MIYRFFLVLAVCCLPVAARAQEALQPVEQPPIQQVQAEKPEASKPAPVPKLAEGLLYNALKQAINEKDPARAEQFALDALRWSKLIRRDVIGLAVQYAVSATLARGGSNKAAAFWGKFALNQLANSPADLERLPPTTRNYITGTVRDVMVTMAQTMADAGDIDGAEDAMLQLKQWEQIQFAPQDLEDTSTTEQPRTMLFPMTPQEKVAYEMTVQWLAQPSGSSKDLISSVNAALASPAEKLGRAPAAVLEEDESRSRSLGAVLKQLGSQADNTVGLTYIVAPDKVTIIASTGKERRVFPVAVARRKLALAINDFLEDVKDQRDTKASGAVLYQWLVAPVRGFLDEVKAVHLVMSLDGVLRYLPFAVLPDVAPSGPSHQYLVEAFDFAMFPVTSSAGTVVRKKPMEWRIAAMGVTQSFAKTPDLAALPGVKQELTQLLADGHLQGEIFLNEAFTKVRLLAELDKPIIHIATHFKLGPTSATSFLLLGNGDQLTLSELRDEPKWNLKKTELLTLSACETAVASGRDADGREIESLAALAQRRGARTVLATLWELPDATAGRFAQWFYLQGEQPSSTMASALQSAQLEAIKRQLPPANWGQYVIMGAWL